MQSIFALIKSLFEKIVAFFRGRGGNVEPELPDPSRVDPGEVICYYGCPNSKKAKKLQLNKTAYR